MSLSIISNYAANVAHRYLVQTDTAATESLAKLSSGQRIVSAKDDPASLTIGSNLSAQLAALQQASTNATQATSMLQVADGALSQIGDILVQMKSLAAQAGSGQLDATNRGEINTEYQSLLSQIDQIANDTTFNGVSLLSGSSMGAVNTGFNVQSGTNNYVTAADGFDSVSFASSVAPTTSSTPAVFTFSYNSATNVLKATNLATSTSQSINIGNGAIAAGTTATYTFGNASVGATVVLNSNFNKAASLEPTASDTFTSSSVGQITTTTIGITAENAAAVADLQTNTVTFNVGSTAGTPAQVLLTLGNMTGTVDLSSAAAKTAVMTNGTDSVTLAFTVGTAFTTNDGAGSFTVGALGTAISATPGPAGTSFTYRIGPGTTSYDNVTVTMDQTTVAALGLSGGDVLNVTDANVASVAIDNAINTLNTSRANIGASENRLQFVSNNLATTIENIDAARGSLLDVDVASEMTNFTNLQVLEQTGIAMLAQANQMPQHLLRLFQ